MSNALRESSDTDVRVRESVEGSSTEFPMEHLKGSSMESPNEHSKSDVGLDEP